MPRYRITLNSWDSYKVFLEAPTKQAAEEQAQKLWDDEGPEVFEHCECDTDYIEAEVIL